jgi:hypothetical protein
MNGIGPLVSAYVHARPHGHGHVHGAQSKLPTTPTNPSTDPGGITPTTNDKGPDATVALSDAARAKFAAWVDRHDGGTAGAGVAPVPVRTSPAPDPVADPVSTAPTAA